ncbi:hypothetical protein G7Y89_g6026 [Cudoniella acicularis]|uniref:Uncharacterized protein n=1 Tax=Cudoniella acicularis TaxID=354080 RepID=A0A8H4RNJ0_9HELO|nr:hypothetical protein G7Y89_g6026 [Cudoniella acicularis]
MFSQWKLSYHRIGTESAESMGEKERGAHQNRRPFPCRSTNIFLWAIISICGVAILLALSLYQFKSSNAENLSQSHGNTCGNSSSEALSLGCSFDQLMWAWYPKQCPHYANDQYLVAEPENPWKFYINPYTKEVASDDDWTRMLNNEVQLYGERREHLTHCVFMYLSVGQIIRDGGRYTPKQVDYEHLHHCSKILLEALRKDDTWFGIETGTPRVAYDQTC